MKTRAFWPFWSTSTHRYSNLFFGQGDNVTIIRAAVIGQAWKHFVHAH
jgi:hypothetical protein